MAFTRPHSTAADATFSAAGAAAWNANQTPTGADVGGIPYCPTATSETTSANLTYSEASGPRLTVGSSGTSSGWILGYGGSNNIARIWHSGLTPSSGNFVLSQNSANDTVVNAQSGAFLGFAINGSNKAQLSPTAGAGFAILAGTATTDVQALSATQTWNAAGVPFTAEKTTVTMTAFHADSLVRDWRNAGGSLFAIHNTGAFGGVGTTYANRPSAPWAGCIHNITDSNTATWGATIAGGGANNVLARYNGANWTVVGA